MGKCAVCDEAVKEMKCQFDCDEVGALAEYVGCKITHDECARTLKFTQPVMIQSFLDEFDIDKEMKKPPKTPSKPNIVLVPAVPEDYAPIDVQKYYRKGVGKLLHMMR